MRCLLPILSILCIASSYGQDELVMYGVFKDHETQKPSSGTVAIHRIEDGSIAFDTSITRNGKYKIVIPYEGSFLVVFKGEGLTTSSVKIDTHVYPEEVKRGGFGFMVDMVFLREVEGVDYTPITSRPSRSVIWDAPLKRFNFDTTYYGEYESEFERVLALHKARKKELKQNR